MVLLDSLDMRFTCFLAAARRKEGDQKKELQLMSRSAARKWIIVGLLAISTLTAIAFFRYRAGLKSPARRGVSQTAADPLELDVAPSGVDEHSGSVGARHGTAAPDSAADDLLDDVVYDDVYSQWTPHGYTSSFDEEEARSNEFGALHEQAPNQNSSSSAEEQSKEEAEATPRRLRATPDQHAPSSAEERRLWQDYYNKYTRCFSGDTLVAVEGYGHKEIRHLQEGDSILVPGNDAGDSATLHYEPFLGHLHGLAASAFAGDGHMLKVVHATGSLELSNTHMIFVLEQTTARRPQRFSKAAIHLDIGDELEFYDAINGRLTRTPVLAVQRHIGLHGMYAPLTPSGTIIVNGAAASSYAAAKTMSALEHGAMHASMFYLRTVAGLSALLSSGLCMWLILCLKFSVSTFVLWTLCRPGVFEDSCLR